MALKVEIGRSDNNGGRTHKIGVDSWQKASQIVRAYIEEFDLTSSGATGAAWTGGKVFDDESQVGRISYNGRAWKMDGTEIDLAPVTHIWFSAGVPEGFKFHSLSEAEAFASMNPRGQIVPAAEFRRA